MTEQKRQLVATIMDSDNISEQDVDQLINDSETRSIWSRFHLVRDIIKGEVPKNLDLDFDQKVSSVILEEPTLLVPSARRKSEKAIPTRSPLVTNIREWAQQGTGLAIAASVTAIMVFGVQHLNSPQVNDFSASAITSLEFLEVDSLDLANKLQLVEQPTYTKLQEDLLDVTRNRSQYGLQFLKPQVSVVNHSVTVPLTLIKSNFDSLLQVSELQESELDENSLNESKETK
ncbi:MAG: hypothetical protein COA74_05110 [Gammaproteobacteria bacterium]|nr:MAG: hypothetical protein COA74_05110 [Gammaproteobacteria bacterium]